MVKKFLSLLLLLFSRVMVQSKKCFLHGTELVEETKELKKTLDEVSEASKGLEKKLETRERQTRILVAENKKLKSELDKPLKEQV